MSDYTLSELTDNPISSISGWSFSGASSNTYKCGSYPWVFGQFGGSSQVYKSFSCPSAFYQVEFTFDFLKMDSWDPPTNMDYVNVMIAGSTVKQLTKSDFLTSLQAQCNYNGDSNWYESMKTFTVSATLTSSPVQLKFVSSFDEPDGQESWGIRNLRVSFKLCDSLCNT